MAAFVPANAGRRLESPELRVSLNPGSLTGRFSVAPLGLAGMAAACRQLAEQDSGAPTQPRCLMRAAEHGHLVRRAVSSLALLHPARRRSAQSLSAIWRNICPGFSEAAVPFL